MRRPASARVRVRRAPHLVAYWRNGTFILRNYATGEASRVSPVLLLVLDCCRDWTSAEEILARLPAASPATVTRAVARLTARTLLERSDRPRDPRVAGMSALDPWNPEAGFFHTATKDVRFWSPRRARREAVARAELTPMPAPVKCYRGVRLVPLPRPAVDADLPRVLLARRTWRRYGAGAVSIDELAAALGLSLGVQRWARAFGGELPLKTSPSGGARHPVEGYVVVRRVQGVPAGVYHYASARHALERLRGPVPAARLRAYVPRSPYFANAAVLVLFTAVFERQLWRYPYSRAYRAALIEAGHVCQTFLLTATWLGLAPFSVMGLGDSTIERDLGLDGISESVLYAAGFGRPPRGSAWAPLPRGTLQVRDNPAFRPASLQARPGRS